MQDSCFFSLVYAYERKAKSRLYCSLLLSFITVKYYLKYNNSLYFGKFHN